MVESIKLILKGGVIGVANIIPGVSGGTMAVVLGIYEDLIEAIGNFVTNSNKRKAYTLLLLKIAIGALGAIVALSWVMDFLLNNYYIYTYLFFIGLIAGSIPAIYKTHPDMQISTASLVAFTIGFCIIIAFSVLLPDLDKPGNIDLEYQASVSGWILLFVSGVFAGGSMIVPGISGSFVLVLLGQYAIIIKAIKDFDIGILTIVAIGAFAGILGFAKLIDILLKSFPKETFYFILGLVVASLYSIFPGLPDGMLQILLSILIVTGGIATAYLLGKKGYSSRL
jgi:putative membrane protein